MITAVLIILISLVWLFTGWLGWCLTIWWWTQDIALTREDRRHIRPLILAGPVNLIAGLIYVAEILADRHARSHGNDNDIIYPRKDN